MLYSPKFRVYGEIHTVIRLWSYSCGIIGQSSDLAKNRGSKSDGGELSTHTLRPSLQFFSLYL